MVLHTVKSWIEAVFLFKTKKYAVKIPWNRIFACFYSNRAFIHDFTVLVFLNEVDFRWSWYLKSLEVNILTQRNVATFAIHYLSFIINAFSLHCSIYWYINSNNIVCLSRKLKFNFKKNDFWFFQHKRRCNIS